VVLHLDLVAPMHREPAPSRLTPASRDLATRNQRQRSPRRFLRVRVVTASRDKREDQPEPTHARAPNAAELRTVGRWPLGSIEGHAPKLGRGRPRVKTDARVRRCILEWLVFDLREPAWAHVGASRIAPVIGRLGDDPRRGPVAAGPTAAIASLGTASMLYGDGRIGDKTRDEHTRTA